MAHFYKKPAANTSLFINPLPSSKKTLNTLEKIYALILPLVKDKLYQIKPIKRGNGRAPYEPEFLFRIIFIRVLYNLSERELREHILDRVSFMKFVGISSESDYPSRKTLRRFLKSLGDVGLGSDILNNLFEKLHQDGIKVSKGTIVDAKYVEAQGRKSDSSKRRDKDAKFSKKNNETHFGYKLHIAIDKKTKLVTKVEVTPGNVADITILKKWVEKDKLYKKTSYIIADRGYDSRSDLIAYKRQYDLKLITGKRKLSKVEKTILSSSIDKHNCRISAIRSHVEHVFARLVTEFKIYKARFYDLKTNSIWLEFMLLILNAKILLKRNYAFM